MDVERVDFAELVAFLRETFATDPPVGFVIGRTRIRDAVAGRLCCSLLQAEELVDTMVLRGVLRLIKTNSEQPDSWQFKH